MNEIDAVVLNFDKGSLLYLNIALAFIMFGIALELELGHFKSLIKQPKSLLVGLFSQVIALPFFTYLLILVLQPIPSIALGMMMVAACPGGNISNFFSALAKANIALSIGMTSAVSLLAIFLTPFNLAIYGNLYEPTALILKDVELNWFELISTVGLIIIVPTFLGMWFRSRYKSLSIVLHKYFKVLSILFFLALIFILFGKNFDHFTAIISSIFFIVFLHNALAYFTGFGISSLFSLSNSDRKSITIETGIQNSGLGLILIFTFFEGLGGMAVVAAWWGIWHIISGLFVSSIWNKLQP